MPGGTVDDGSHAEQQLIARALGALMSLEQFDSRIYLARAIHNATLALSMYADNLPALDAVRIQDLRRKSLRMALSDDLPGITEADRDWIIAAMRQVLGKGGDMVLAEDRLQ